MTEDRTLATAAPTAPARAGLLRPVAKPHEIAEAHKEAVALISQVLEKDRDFGTIPGTGDKPTLLKPGAERLCISFGVGITYEIVEKEIDHDRVNVYDTKYKQGQRSVGLYRYVVKAILKRRDTGEWVGDGLGACSTMESKYISRPRDCENTALKMAEKRALVAAVLNTFGLSDRFTQDVEEIRESQEAYERKAPVQTPGVWFGSIGGTKEQAGTIKALARSRGLSLDASLIEARDAGCTTPEAVIAYLSDGDDPEGPIDAELVEEPTAPTTGASAAEPTPASPADSTGDDFELMATEARKFGTQCRFLGRDEATVRREAWAAGVRDFDGLMEFAAKKPEAVAK
jgi:hypothetical protein